MDELIDILDLTGNYSGKTALKSEAHKHGWFYATVHIWIYTKDRHILLQQRGATKKTYPGLWDVSVAGHIHAGESIINGALREIEEEIGWEVQEKDLQKIAVRKGMRSHPNGIQDNEFYHVFLVELTTGLKNLKKQVDEVDDLKLFDLNVLKSTNEQFPMVPNISEYYQFILKNIQAILQ
ncbi:MAG: NUDIX domain-containing protein [Flavobacteriaceae bacterium]|nr:NUDIX domain-containing protein [Flavobacteriaceae bacterium]